jgi:hypothetical protein
MVHVARRQRRHVPPRATRTTVSTTCGAWRLEKENPEFPRAGIGAAADPAASGACAGRRRAADDTRRAGPSACMPRLCWLRAGRVADVRGRTSSPQEQERLGKNKTSVFKGEVGKVKRVVSIHGRKDSPTPPKKITTQRHRFYTYIHRSKQNKILYFINHYYSLGQESISTRFLMVKLY